MIIIQTVQALTRLISVSILNTGTVLTLEEIGTSQSLDILCFFPVCFVYITNSEEIYKVCK